MYQISLLMSIPTLIATTDTIKGGIGRTIMESDLESEEFKEDMLRMLDDGVGDVTILLKDGEMKAHMIILAVRMPEYFRMRQQDPTKTIDMKHTEMHIMRTIISFLYTGGIDFNKMILEDLLKMCAVFREFILSTQFDRCVNFLTRNIRKRKFAVEEVANGISVAMKLKINDEVLIQSFLEIIQESLNKPYFCPECSVNENIPPRAPNQLFIKYPYNVLKEILKLTFELDVKIQVFNAWWEENKGSLEADQTSVIFKDYRCLVSKDIGVIVKRRDRSHQEYLICTYCEKKHLWVWQRY